MIEMFTGSFTSSMIAILTGLVVCVIAFYKWSFTYWKRKGVPEVSKPSSIDGALQHSKKCKAEVWWCLHMGKTHPRRDTSLMKNILQTEFPHFVNHGTFANTKNDLLAVHLFNMENGVWKDWRIKLTPTFTTGKMKMMFHTLVNVTDSLKEILAGAMDAQKPIDLKEVAARYTTDVIASVAFGIECNSLKNPDISFRRYSRLALEDLTIAEHIKTFLQFVLPHKIFSMLNMRITNKKVEKFFMEVVKNTVQYREKNYIYRKVFMHLMLQLKKRGKLVDDESIKGNDSEGKSHLTTDELSAQCYLFFVAGFETSSTVSSFVLYEIAKNQNVQDKLREEVLRLLEKHGLRFGIMQTKVLISTLVLNSRLTLNEKTKEPLDFKPEGFITGFSQPILLDVEKL